MGEDFLFVYNNSRCTKCVIAENYFKTNGKRYILYNYLEKGLSKNDIVDILKFGNFGIKDILRKDEREYIEFIQGKDLGVEELIELLIRYPRMLQRPIVVDRKNKKAYIARDSNILEEI